MFQFSGLALLRVTHLQCARLSHSEIFGLMLVCSYPKLIAAYHVLHRLPVPRHPPYALIRFKYCWGLHNATRFYNPAISYYAASLFLYLTTSCRTLGRTKIASQYVKDLLNCISAAYRDDRRYEPASTPIPSKGRHQKELGFLPFFRKGVQRYTLFLKQQNVF